MPESLRVVMVASEMFPFAKSGGLGDVLGALPKALVRAGEEVAVFLPAYRTLLEGGGFAATGEAERPDAFGDPECRYSLYRTRREGVEVFAVRCGGLFDREGYYEDASGEYADNALRFCRFCRGALSALETLGAAPDILHCHDWQAALVPALLRWRRPASAFWARTATVFTVHNLAYQGRFGSDQFMHTALPPQAFSIDGLEYFGDMNLMKGALLFADAISTVSGRYAEEIQTEEQGEGLQGVIANRAGDLFGILNGVDYQVWNPAEDRHLPAPFDLGRMEGKARSRERLRREFGLEAEAEGPLCVMVSRLVRQKGIELVLETLDDLMEDSFQLAVLGTGEKIYREALGRAAKRHPGRVAFRPGYREGLAHLMYGGGDVVLMPSRYEPSGLNQLYAMRYGTLPVVRAVGGLAESVIAHEGIDGGRDTGFRFEAFAPADFLGCLRRAGRAFRNKPLWEKLVRNAMSADFGWERAALRYVDMYQQARARRAARAG